MNTVVNQKNNAFEKMIFLEMKYKQLWTIPKNEEDFKDYWKVYKSLSMEEKDLINTKLFHEIHKIWNYINSKNIDGTRRHQINSILEYHNNVEKVSEIILKISKEYNITLKYKMPEKLKNAIKYGLGKNRLDHFLKGE
tara:strand:+ start:61 stop:474 length:414 start_codon:yes stop_codon:yes gene_type:complete